MKSEFKNKRIVAMCIVFGIVVGLVIAYPAGIEKIYIDNYLVDSLCLIMSIVMLLRLYINDKVDMFEPLILIAAVYIMMYFFTPIYDICVGELKWYGYDLFQYGIRATVIEFVGFIVFYFFYTHYFTFGDTRKDIHLYKDNDIHDNEVKVSISLILLMYIFCFVANVYYLMRSGGNSLLYLLTLGLSGNGGSTTVTESSLGFVSMFSYCLPAVTLLYWEFGKSKLVKIILFIPMFMLQVARGFRFFVIQIIITFFAYYFIKNKKRPNMINIILAALVLMIPVLLMTLFRVSLREGTGMDLSGISLKSIQNAFDAAVWDNFRIYQNVYGMVHVIPDTYGYVYGRQLVLGTIYMVIPRIIWPGKLSSYGGFGLTTLIGSNIASGQAYPNIGEFYYAGGILGVIICMAIYGMWMKYVRDRFMYSDNKFNWITYSVLLGANLQLIIRGYMPSNFWYVVFSILPVWIVRKFGIRRVGY